MRKLLPTLLAAIVLAVAAPAAAEADADATVMSLARGWDNARYAISDETAQIAALRELKAQSETSLQQFPDEPRLRVWRGVIMASLADDVDMMEALKLAHQSLKILQAAERTSLDPPTTAMTQTILGVLYDQAPPFPVAFGDAKAAETHFKAAIVADPAGIEPNFYYADFLCRKHRYKDAIAPLKRAIEAPPREGREVGDRALRQAATALLAAAQRRIGS